MRQAQWPVLIKQALFEGSILFLCKEHQSQVSNPCKGVCITSKMINKRSPWARFSK